MPLATIPVEAVLETVHWERLVVYKLRSPERPGRVPIGQTRLLALAHSAKPTTTTTQQDVNEYNGQYSIVLTTMTTQWTDDDKHA